MTLPFLRPSILLEMTLSSLLAYYMVSSSAQGDNAQLPAPPPTPTSTEGGLLNQKYLLGDFNKERTKLEDEGVLFRPIYSGEVLGTPSGGEKRGVTYKGLLNPDLTPN